MAKAKKKSTKKSLASDKYAYLCRILGDLPLILGTITTKLDTILGKLQVAVVRAPADPAVAPPAVPPQGV
jgi:hypothetical protein